MIGYVQVHTENLELFRPRVQFSCTEHWWVIFFYAHDNTDTTRGLVQSLLSPL